MTLKDLIEKLSSKRYGTYTTITFKKEYGECTKTTTTTIRLVNYYSVVKKEPNKDTKRVSSDKYLGHNIIYNENTQKTRLQVFLTNNPNHKPKSIYEYQGKEITKEEFYERTNKKPSNVSLMFAIDINDIVSVG